MYGTLNYKHYLSFYVNLCLFCAEREEYADYVEPEYVMVKQEETKMRSCDFTGLVALYFDVCWPLFIPLWVEYRALGNSECILCLGLTLRSVIWMTDQMTGKKFLKWGNFCSFLGLRA